MAFNRKKDETNDQFTSLSKDMDYLKEKVDDIQGAIKGIVEISKQQIKHEARIEAVEKNITPILELPKKMQEHDTKINNILSDVTEIKKTNQRVSFWAITTLVGLLITSVVSAISFLVLKEIGN